MSAPIPVKFYDLFSRPILCAFTTINPDRSPHSVSVWCDFDGAQVLLVGQVDGHATYRQQLQAPHQR